MRIPPLDVAASTAFFALLVTGLAVGALPAGAVVVYAVASTVAFGLYGADKAAARRGTWRTSEAALHTVALLGGWPGALLGQRVFHHKTRKQPFRAVFWLTVAANCLALGLFVTSALRG